ncbi:MAG: Hsp20 family protein [Bacteroidetes bacterium]|nr:Hsp20 family protein [Bacteroidota bacterium]
MRITRFNPTKPEVHNWMDNFFNTSLGNVLNDDTSVLRPDVNVKETDNEYIMEVAAPGLEKSDFDIEIEDGSLTLSAEKKNEEEDKGDKYLRREFQYTSFSRSFHLPENVKVEDVEAKYIDGVLHVSIPKAQPTITQPRRIEIS